MKKKAKDSDNKNIILITTDQEHYFENYPEGSSYEARMLLQEMGTTFEKHYCCANMSTSSRSVMYTGQHIPNTGMHDNTDLPWQPALDDGLITIGDRMNDAGYYSAYKGKWHMGKGTSIFGGEEETAEIDLNEYGFKDWGGVDYIGGTHEGNTADPVIASEAAEWITTKGIELNDAGQPFFLSVNLVNPHDIMEYATEDGYESPSFQLAKAPDNPLYEKKYSAELPGTWNQNLNTEGVVDSVRNYKQISDAMYGKMEGEDACTDYQNYYLNCIQDSDNNLMKIISAIKDSGLIDNTIIILTADHGDMHCAHGLKGKGGLIFENNIHVPLIIVHPDIEGGKRINALTSHVDLAPSIIDLTGTSSKKKAELKEGLAGKSFVPLLFEETESVRDASLFCYEMLSMATYNLNLAENAPEDYLRAFVRAIVTDRYKFARYFDPFHFQCSEDYETLVRNCNLELYDLKNDPEEKDNIAADPNNKELVMKLNAQLNELISEEIGQDDGQYFSTLLQKS